MKKTKDIIDNLLSTEKICEQFNGGWQNYLMRNNGFYVGFNMPEALSGESTFGLPPFAKRMPYLVDKYSACPKDWLRSEGIIKSYFVPVKENKGMWLDFNENGCHTHHVAIVVSVQGINPITGMPCEDAQLEQYIEECPKHKIKFGPDRYCSKCDYKWPKQNYICTTGTPYGSFWLDGFRSVEGVVRQYILSSEKMRGVASNIIGKDRVYAIGLSFFISKEKKPKNLDTSMYRIGSSTVPYACTTGLKSSTMSWGKKYIEINNPDLIMGDFDHDNYSYIIDQLDNTANDPNMTFTTHHAFNVSDNSRGTLETKASNIPVQIKKLEVGAGAKINQLVYDDPERLDFWHDKPESIICINYVDEKDAVKIIQQGEIDIEGHEEGFLKDIPVGN